ncbi:MAG: thiol:disulfide interchange protein [Bacteroidetes bacterium]|nr:thiol:disulfide interchange protein [Bacteroidota bacterium]
MLKKLSLLLLLLITGSSVLFSQELHSQWTFTAKKITECEYDLQFNASINEGWHIFSLQVPPDGPLPTVFKFKKKDGIELVGKMTQSKPIVEYDKIFDAKLEYYEHSATFTQRIRLKTDKKVTIQGEYEYQICTDAKCDLSPPGETFEFQLQGTKACVAETPASTTPVGTVTTITTSSSSVQTAEASENTDTVTLRSEEKNIKHKLGTQVTPTTERPKETRTWWGIFIAGFIGGALALLTPCVFPMIPMNVSFFTKQSKTKAQGIRNALFYSVSIIVLYVGLGLGVTLIFGAGALHSLSTNVWFNLAFFVLLLVFAMSFLGAFEITLPSGFVNKIDAKADRGGYIGIFFMAFTLALVSFSCTGPIIGTLLVEASSTGNITGPFWGMFGFALALALPFGLFAAFPGWLNSLPQSGGWLNAVKVTLGFLELALALKFASNADLVVQAGILTREVFVGLWIVIFALLTMYLLGLFKTSHDSDLKHVSVGRLFIAMASFFVTIYLIPGMWGAPLKLFSGILPPLEYSESPHGFGGSGASAAESLIPQDEEFGKYMEVNTEDYVWPDPEVKNRLNKNVVLVSLYVDDKRELDPKDYQKVFWYGKERELTDIGDKFKYMEEKVYGQSTQPLYVLVDSTEKVLNTIRGYDPSITDYIKWLDEGIANYKK